MSDPKKKNGKVVTDPKKPIYKTGDNVKYGTPEYTKAYNKGEIVTDKGVRSPIALDEVVIQNNYKRPRGFWEQYRDKIVDENKDASLMGAIVGTPISAITSLPQLAATYALTDKVQRPSEAMIIKNPYGAMAVDAIADPANLIGAGILTKENALSKLGKIPTSISSELGQSALSNVSGSFGNKAKNFLRNNVFTDKAFNRLETINNSIQKLPNVINPSHHIKAQKNLNKANQWMDNWYNDPITKQKIKEATKDEFGYGSFEEQKLLDNIENKTYKTSFEANMNKLDNFLDGTPRAHKGNYGVSGWYLDRYKDASKRQNLVDKYIDSDMITSTGIHEGNHGLTNGNDLISGYKDILQSPFDIENFKPRLDNGDFEKHSDYLLDPTEINARVSEIRYEHNLKPGEDLTPKKVSEIINKGLSGKSNVDPEFYRLINDRNKFKDMMNYVPAVVPAAIGINAVSNSKTPNNIQNADGGQIHNNLNGNLNNYLNNNMKQYAQGGKLTRFDEGGTHEQNPLGGIPQGQDGQGNMNTVEQGETKKGNFVYSDRITLNKDLIKQFNLPGYVSNKSVSAASKAIDDKFKDRQDKYAQETKKTLLGRLSEAQEHIKAQEQAQQEQINQSMQANSQQVPDMMEGQIPEGMEEYTEQGQQQNPQEEMMEVQNQMYLGGSFGIAEAGNMTAGGKGIGANTPLSKVYAGQQYMMGGHINKYPFGGRPQITPLDLTPAGLVSTPTTMPTAPIADANKLAAGVTNTAGTAGGAGSIPGGVAGALGMASGVMGLANLSQGNGASTNKGMSALSGAMQGAAGGAALGPIGAGVGAVIGAGAGLLGSAAASRQEMRENDTAAATYNNQFTDKYAFGGTLKPGVKYSVGNSTIRPSVEMKNNTVNMMAQGGGLTSKDRGSDNKPYPSVDSSDFAGGGRSYPIPTKADAVDALRLAGLHGRSDVRSKVFAKYPSLKHANGGELTKDMFGDDSNLYVNRYAVGGDLTTVYDESEDAQPVYDSNNNLTTKGTLKYSTPPMSTYRPMIYNPNSFKRPSGEFASSIGKTPTVGSSFNNVNKTAFPQNQLAENFAKNNLLPKGVVNPNPIFGDKYKTSATGNTAGDTGKESWFDRNSGKFGEAMRYAPVAMNAYQLSQLRKPQGVQYNTLQDKFIPQYADEAQLQNIAGQTQRNQINALSQSGASPAQMRAAILGAGVNMNRGLSESYMGAVDRNRATNERGQAFDASINAQNVGIKNRAIDEYRADQGNYDTQRSKFLGAIGTDIGSIGKEEVNKDQIASMLGYTWRGKYLVDKNGNKATPQQIAQAKNAITSGDTKPVYNATTGEKINYGSYGGFLKTNKRGY